MSLVVALFLALVTRVLFWSTKSTDDMVHLWNVRLRKKHGNIQSHEPLDSVVPGMRGYPTLAHWVVSLFPEDKWRLAGKSLNVGYDLVLVLLAWGTGVILFPEKVDGVSLPFLIAVLVATSPSLLPVTSRIKSMGGRTLGNLLVFGYFNALWFGLYGFPVFGVIASVICFLLVVLSSKFALQAILFMTPLVALFSLSMFPLLVLCVSIAATFLVPGLGLREVLGFMYAHSRWYHRNSHIGTTASARNRWADIRDLPMYFKSNKDVFWGILFRRSSYFIGLYSFPLVWFVFLWLGQGGDEMGYITYAAYTTIASFCIFLLTSLKPFLFLGQAERYLEYVVPFASVVGVATFSQGLISMDVMYGLVFFQLSMTLINCIYSNYAQVKQAIAKPTPSAVQAFLDMSSGFSVLTIPTKFAHEFSSMRGPNTFYYRAINTPKNGLLYKEEDYAWFEMPREDLTHFYIKYGVDTVIVHKPFLSKAQERGLDYKLEQYSVLYEDDAYLVVSIVSELNHME